MAVAKEEGVGPGKLAGAPAKTVDDYISNAPRGTRAKLLQVRAAILEVAPAAKENISYGLPHYYVKGSLAWFGIFKEHIGLFVRPPILEEHKNELKGYETTKSSLHLPLMNEIPIPLVKKLVKAALARNEREWSA
jgi:uncharacterized protein YdhG (YjbR/CyaY superfamily)